MSALSKFVNAASCTASAVIGACACLPFGMYWGRLLASNAIEELARSNAELQQTVARMQQDSWRAYSMWMLDNIVNGVHAQPLLFTMVVVLLLFIIYYWFRVRPAVHLQDEVYRTCGDGCEDTAKPYVFRTQESLRDEPITETRVWPRGALIVVGKRGGPIGSAMRLTQTAMLILTHVLADGVKVMGPSHKEVVLEQKNAREIATDVSIVYLGEDAWSLLGCAVVKVAKQGLRSTSVRCVAPGGTCFQQSFGQVTSDATIGGLEYSGSTQPGFSGAQYLYADGVVGMHLGGGLVNCGISVAFCKAIELSTRKQESSEDFVERLLTKTDRRRKKLRYLPLPNGDILLQDQGEFHVVEGENFWSALERADGEVQLAQSRFDLDEPEAAYPTFSDQGNESGPDSDRAFLLDQLALMQENSQLLRQQLEIIGSWKATIPPLTAPLQELEKDVSTSLSRTNQDINVVQGQLSKKEKKQRSAH